MIVFPQGKEFVVALLCVLVGGFVIVKFCLEQFDKASISSDDNDPWKFLVTRFLTSREQYLTGFAVYCGIMLAIFLTVSLFPGAILDVIKAVAAAAAGDIQHPPAVPTEATLQSYPTFPILVAFYIVGLNPNLPKMLDFEIIIRRIGHRIAYVPKNMDQIFNFMRFSEFDLSDQQLQRGWEAADLRRTTLDAPDLKSLAPVFNRAVVLYARAGMLAGDITMDGATDLPQNVNLEVFKQYRGEIRNVGVNLQAINARLAEQAGASLGDRRRAMQTVQRDLIKNLELLYAIFASATTTKGIERLSDRLRAIGFTSAFPPRPGIPWDPLLKVLGAATPVMIIACAIAAATFVDAAQNLIPTAPANIAYLLVTILVVQGVAIWQALRVRARLIGLDECFYEIGKGRALAYLRIFFWCAVSAWPIFILFYLPKLISALPSGAGDTSSSQALSSPQIVGFFLQLSVASVINPGTCGLMTAYTLDRPTDTSLERFVSGLLQGGAMAAAAVVVAQLAPPDADTRDVLLAYHVFLAVLYGGLGFVLGFLLPAAIRRHWRVQEAHLPEKIRVLRTAVLQYFRDIQQFMEWLNTRNDRLDGKRPLDVLTEESGLQKLTSLVTETRTSQMRKTSFEVSCLALASLRSSGTRLMSRRPLSSAVPSVTLKAPE
jgi:hypothetical protein